jgi:hypothetical protein
VSSNAFAPHGQLNRATLHGTGAGMTTYSAIEAILDLSRRLVNAGFGAEWQGS